MAQTPPRANVRSGTAAIADRVAAPVVRAARWLGAVRPVWVLVPLVLLQWAVTARLALEAKHNAWLWYHGGDGTYYWTTTWSLAHHHLPATVISYGLPVVLWPVALFAGANILAALPAIVLLQVLVLAPIGVVVMYALGGRIGGRLFGYLVVVAWIVSPVVAIWWFTGGGTEPPDLRNLVVPNTLGLSPIGDYASMILALVATWLVVRALDDRRWNDVVFAGLAAGALIAVKPSNAYFLLAPLVAFAAARRWREGLVFFALLVPPLVTLAVWKEIGLGTIPIASPPASVLAAGTGIAPSPTNLDRYFLFDWKTFSDNLGGLREDSRLFSLLVVATIAGLVGIVRRAPIPGITVATWFLAYLLFKGGAEGRAGVHDTTFFRLVMPGYPAFVLIGVSVVFLVPRVRRRTVHRAIPARPTLAALLVAVVVLAYPLGMVGTAHAWPEGTIVSQHISNVLVPVSSKLRPRVRVGPDAVRLSWRPVRGPTRVFYRVFRSGIFGCMNFVETTDSRECEIDDAAVGFTALSRFEDQEPLPGYNTYRVGLYAAWTGKVENADLLLVGPPVTVVVTP
jgi:hypothetical protein